MTGTQNTIEVDDSCVPKNQTLASPIDFENAARPAFLTPYKIIEKAGVRIALIGIDFHLTTSVTTSENVSDLCFRDEASSYLDLRKSLDGKADVFVILMHNGNVLPSTFTASDIVTKINQAMPGAVDLVAAGHTHQTHNNVVGDVHVIQDGCNGTQYGRVDIYVDPDTKKVLPAKTDSWAGLAVKPDVCDTTHAAFACSQLSLPVPTLPTVAALVLNASQNVAPIGQKKLATASEVVTTKRVGESAEGDLFSDLLRRGTGTQIAFMNSGGIRASVQKGDFLYQNLFEIIPFGNLAVVIDAFPWKNLRAILEHTIKSSGAYGTLNESGLKIVYAASDPDNTTQLFKTSELEHVELLDGTVLFDRASNVNLKDDQTFSVTTLDFLASGGGGYDFGGVPISRTLRIARDVIADSLSQANPALVLQNKIDGRFVNSTAAP